MNISHMAQISVLWNGRVQRRPVFDVCVGVFSAGDCHWCPIFWAEYQRGIGYSCGFTLLVGDWPGNVLGIVMGRFLVSLCFIWLRALPVLTWWFWFLFVSGIAIVVVSAASFYFLGFQPRWLRGSVGGYSVPCNSAIVQRARGMARIWPFFDRISGGPASETVHSVCIWCIQKVHHQTSRHIARLAADVHAVQTILSVPCTLE